MVSFKYFMSLPESFNIFFGSSEPILSVDIKTGFFGCNACEQSLYLIKDYKILAQLGLFFVHLWNEPYILACLEPQLMATHSVTDEPAVIYNRGLSPVNWIFSSHAHIAFIQLPVYYNVEVTDYEISIQNILKFTNTLYNE